MEVQQKRWTKIRYESNVNMAIKAQRGRKEKPTVLSTAAIRHELIKYKLVGWQAAIFGIWCSVVNLTSSHPPIVITVYPSSNCVSGKLKEKKVLKKIEKSKEQILIVVTDKCCWWCTARHNSHPNFVRSERSCFLPFGCQGPLHTIKVEVNPHLVTREWTRCNTLFLSSSD